MSHVHPEPEDAAPACPHDDLETYWSGSPMEDTFAPGVLHASRMSSEYRAIDMSFSAKHVQAEP